eukprot:TRINITY_DN983_c0_g1_i1.p1 TRINITY_DN983_c0_g1~~TRINITY_DN983_c0_g1_i1.p1  ORF type:complete len:195 (+),score=66.79 TRINITY_DN983_c0_g1_i1:72-656(+)
MKLQEDLLADKDKRFRLLQEKKSLRQPLPPTPTSDVSKKKDLPLLSSSSSAASGTGSLRPRQQDLMEEGMKSENHSKEDKTDTKASKYHRDIAGLMADLDAESEADEEEFRATVVRRNESSRPATQMSMSGMSLIGEERLDLDFSEIKGEEFESDSDSDDETEDDDIGQRVAPHEVTKTTEKIAFLLVEKILGR